MFTKLIEKVKSQPKTIVFTEGTDARIQEAASRLLAEKLMGVILVGKVDEVNAAAKDGGFDITGAEILDPETYEGMQEMIDTMVELRKGKMTPEECKDNLLKGNYFGTMLVKMGKADCLLGGAAMGDCAVNIDYKDDLDKDGNVKFSGAQKLAEVAVEIEHCARTFGIDPKVAMLSFSTKGSGKGGTVALSAEAAKIAKELNPDMALDGEMQFDAAVSPTVGQLKFPGSPVAGYANTFVFPCIEAGNIGYKIAQRLGGYAAYGPVLTGLNAPINDLSRGCDAEEVYKMSIITAAL